MLQSKDYAVKNMLNGLSIQEKQPQFRSGGCESPEDYVLRSCGAWLGDEVHIHELSMFEQPGHTQPPVTFPIRFLLCPRELLYEVIRRATIERPDDRDCVARSSESAA